ncbi:MAG: hypothetical protein HY290_17730 [Planctomycetia bacterium]|nr:hypothetical protein [Planctomycetia bacterium]
MLDQFVIREFNIGRIKAGMTQAEVEAILGQPNPLPDLKRKSQAFWDTHCQFGTKYLSLHVNYDADGIVESTQVSGFRRSSSWW